MNDFRRDVITVQRKYPIKEFSELTGVPQQTLRNWEEVFGGGFPVDRDPQNQRYYTDHHVKLIEMILKWKDQNQLTNSQIAAMLLEYRNMNPFEQGLIGENDSGSTAIAANVAEELKSQTLAIGRAFSEQIDKQMSMYISQMQAMLTMNIEEQRGLIREEIHNALQSISDRDSQLVSALDEQNKSHRIELTERLNEIAIKAETQSGELHDKLSTLIEKDIIEKVESTSKQVEALNKDMQEKVDSFAVIMKEEIENYSKNIREQKKWFKFW